MTTNKNILPIRFSDSPVSSRSGTNISFSLDLDIPILIDQIKSSDDQFLLVPFYNDGYDLASNIFEAKFLIDRYGCRTDVFILHPINLNALLKDLNISDKILKEDENRFQIPDDKSRIQAYLCGVAIYIHEKVPENSIIAMDKVKFASGNMRAISMISWE